MIVHSYVALPEYDNSILFPYLQCFIATTSPSWQEKLLKGWLAALDEARNPIFPRSAEISINIKMSFLESPFILLFACVSNKDASFKCSSHVCYIQILDFQSTSKLRSRNFILFLVGGLEHFTFSHILI